MFNIYDQANKVIYPDYKSGYWQRQVTPAELPARDIYTRFTQNFSAALDTINTWSIGDRMAGLLLDEGGKLYLARVHNGGYDGSGRPQRWILLLWREDNFSCDHTTGAGAPDIARWLADPRWPTPQNNAPLPLPTPVPDAAYKTPTAGAAADLVQQWQNVSKEFSDVLEPNETEFFPNQLEAGEIAQTPANLAEVQALWTAWSASVRRETSGSLLFCTVGGNFKCVHDLCLARSPVLIRREEKEEAERRRLTEERRRLEQAAREEATYKETERRRQRENSEYLRREERRRKNEKTVNIILTVILMLLLTATGTCLAFIHLPQRFWDIILDRIVAPVSAPAKPQTTTNPPPPKATPNTTPETLPSPAPPTH